MELIGSDEKSGNFKKYYGYYCEEPLNSSDHKLSSGVNWFSKDVFHNRVQYATDLDDAYKKAEIILKDNVCDYINPTYFKDNYWDMLLSKISL